jgi:murein DD-endopeptidase MepM/ murein hydrolase activator NlpD
MRSAIVLLLLLSLPCFSRDGLGDRRSELEDLEHQLESVRANLHDLSDREEDLRAEIGYLEEEERILGSQITLLREQERALRSSLRDVDCGLRSTETTMEATRSRIRSAMVLLYTVLSRRGSPEAPALRRDQRTAESVLTYEKARMDRALRASSRLLDSRNRTSRDLQEVTMLRAEIEEKEGQLLSAQDRKAAALASIQMKKRAEESRENELLSAIAELEQLIAELEKARREVWKDNGIAPEELAGKALQPPVEGDVVSAFGTLWHEKYNTRTRNNGVDVRAQHGSAVRTVESGEVVHSGPFLTFGNLIIIDHDGFFSVYAQLERTRVQVGQRVPKGTVLGSLASDGSGVQPVLHFELRVGGEAVDPLQYVRF